ncbi:MAG: amylo-alpha-1,6-glucosidase [Bacteroidota bacterium]|jgi:predicted glycogen debranching enzyme|nr:glycogen debranching enzyme family protein [Bacteroidales bacterium]MDI9535217.1 amylo-alpha-1,6-glucosidase [Bacteroidota bacterium]OQC44366.1 MAG: Amylo-alpha-1,6-glucosidase [Bacteroidetes bacterium ADurb.Bin028]NLP19152.1 amylo-alpha-1,6-glucosidase [Bacteroidales bacterium]HNY44315.1 amylo-alpha-1,6-glucosidase [Bacteroidales bacterium]
MSYIEFDKEQLINLEYSLKRELLRTNRAGSYASTTIVGCNTRKYHGLLVCPMEDIDNDNHVLLSGIDISVIQNDAIFNFGVRKYPGNNYHPKGHKYVRDFYIDVVPKLVWRVGGVVLQMERILTEDDRIIIKYTLLEAVSKTKIRFKPFLAFRNVHKLSKANLFVNTKFTPVNNGIKLRMYDAYKFLYLQTNKEAEYIHAPDWYYNVEYEEEQRRGYDYQEDLYVPGYFEADIKTGETIIFTAGLDEANPKTLARKYNAEIAKRMPRTNYRECLESAAKQFIYKRKGKSEIVAGYPWFGRWGRDTFISLPGLTLYQNDIKTCKEVLDTMTSEIKDGLFPNIGAGNNAALNSVDAPLWFFWALQEYLKFTKDKVKIWKDFGEKIKNILENFRSGTQFNIKMHDNGLIWAGEAGKALTWMDAVVAGKPVTPRHGFAVEINALWYNAVKFSLELAEHNKDKDFIEAWKHVPEITKSSFLQFFWDDNKHYLADYCTYEYKDWAIRPNQIFACSLPYSPLSEEKRERVLEKVKKELLTPKGLRTLSPSSPDYKGVYKGNQEQRDNAYHQGTAWPWLLGSFCEGWLKIHGESGLALVEKIYLNFEEDMTIAGIGNISEIYDGDPPHNARGAIAQAWSVAELLRIANMIDNYKNNIKS